MCYSSDGGGRTATLAHPLLLLLLLLFLLVPVRSGLCPEGCVCASDILSCSGQALETLPKDIPLSVATLDLNHNRLTQLGPEGFAALPRLRTLCLAHNRLSDIPPGTFYNASSRGGANLRHLDLSSNQLKVLEHHYFLGLAGLEELRLFNNRLVLVESRALAGLGAVRRVYLSHNRLSDFPFFSLQQHSHPHLATLDLSSNRLTKVPLADVSSLPRALAGGLYLHNNSLLCECPLVVLLRGWERRGYPAVWDYRQQLTCQVYGLQQASVRVLQSGRVFHHCDLGAAASTGGPPEQQGAPEGAVLVYVGDRVLLDCWAALGGGPAEGGRVSFQWVSPKKEHLDCTRNTTALRLHGNGTLEIVSARADDAGVYWCMASDGQRWNQTREVNVTVGQYRTGEAPSEPFNTGFTTLLGCVVSLLLVLMYLYLTPCPCRCRQAPPTATPSPGGDAQSSILSPTPPATTEGPGRKVSSNKHVVFMEPIREAQNGRARGLEPRQLLGSGQSQKPAQQPLVKGEAEPIMLVFADTPIVSP